MLFDNPLIPLLLDLGSADPGVRLQAALHIARQLAIPGFLETLRQNRLSSLLYQTLTQFTREEVGEVPLFDQLRLDYLKGLSSYRNQLRETLLLARGLADAGVEVILLKGADIRQRLYDDPVCRPMNDLDVLISPLDLERARDCLEQRGYTLFPRDLDLRPGFTRRFGWVVCYGSSTGELPSVDVHWEIQEAGTFYRLPYGPLRARAATLELEGRPMLVLAPEHLIMHLCLHTFGELDYAHFLQICDLGLALQRFALDWDFFLTEAAKFRIQEPILWIFRGLARWRPALVTEAALDQLATYRPGWAERFIIRRQTHAFLVSALMALWAHHPVRTWPAYLKAKIWPSRAYLEANSHYFPSRKDYLLHILGRTQ